MAWQERAGLTLRDGQWVDQNGRAYSNADLMALQAEYTENLSGSQNEIGQEKSLDDILGQFGYDQYDNRFQSAYEDYWNSLPATASDKISGMRGGMMSPEKMRLLALSRNQSSQNQPSTASALTTPTGGGDSPMMQRQNGFGGGGMPRGPYEPGMPVDPNMGRISVSNSTPDPQDRWGMGSNDRWSGIQKPQQPQQTLPAMDPNDRYGQTQPKKRTFVGTF